jgi:hypothetical protein
MKKTNASFGKTIGCKHYLEKQHNVKMDIRSSEEAAIVDANIDQDGRNLINTMKRNDPGISKVKKKRN